MENAKLDTSKDNMFENINELEWLPWIGEKYFSLPKEKRILIVGESHYHKSKELLKDEGENFTRNVIKELNNIGSYGTSKVTLFKNFRNTLSNKKNNFDFIEFLNNAAFYNFIQTSMSGNDERPSNSQFLEGWNSFGKLVNILEPSVCIFIGTTAYNQLGKYVQSNNDNITKIGYHQRDIVINRTKPKIAELELKKQPLKLVFIRHTSQFYSPEKWFDFLKNEIPYQMLWINENFTKDS